MTLLKAMAPAKVNLFLHVGPPKSNGRHDLDSLVVFSDMYAADYLSVAPAGTLSLTVSGPGASDAGPDGDNLVLKAAHALQGACGTQQGAAITLDKWLPVAAGIGGGSSDAAVVLRLLVQLWNVDPAFAALVAPGLGGDVPVALMGVPALMRGEGERIVPVALPGPLTALLVNPRVPCPTGPVFRAHDASGGGADFREIETFPDFASPADFVRWLSEQRNDLEAPARVLVPEISAVLEFLRIQTGVQLARMSGSGATCFALFDATAFAELAQVRIGLEKRGWWSAVCSLGAAP